MDHTKSNDVKLSEECYQVLIVDESKRSISQLFSSHEEAWDFYKEYARKHSFSALRGTTRLDREGNVKTQEFCCSKEGFRLSKVNIIDRQRAYTPVIRTGCKAKVLVMETNTNDQWVLSKSFQERNHALFTTVMTPFMYSNRAVSKADVDESTTLEDVGVGHHK
ncbi:protein FAR1-RELATED SEQUENCE 5-like [Hibiscus syriacus]|uniref:protein FAR1-RELATED SEQUENCE 5-like n=1 Tax=Hibiscus syriacus TaxID=106335 RepID=UPI001924208C|nr:protein FAR1-RELATED SEQUENCE 5-like [Hibiscus syriacus]